MSTRTAQEKHLHKVLTQIALSESLEVSDKPVMKPMQILRTGTFTDPRYGKFKISRKQFEEMVKNFDQGIRGVVPSLDYSHNTEGKAAGWIKKLYIKDDGKEAQLWGDFELTPGGQRSLADKDFGYLSADFDDKYKDNEEGKTHGCVLLGAALTNRPVIKNMNPAIQLKEGDKEMSEELSEEVKKKLADHEKMCADMKKFADDMGEADPMEAMKKAVAAKGPAKKDEPAADAAAKKEEEQKQMSEIKTLAEKFDAQAKELAELRGQLADKGKEGEFNKMLSEGKVVEAQRDAFMKGNVTELLQKAQLVKTEEQGHGQDAKTIKFGEAATAIEEKAKKLSEEKKISFREAVVQVKKENKELASQYAKEMGQ